MYVVQEIRINGIFFTGGDTAIKAAQCLNVSGTIIRDEILPGIVYGNFIEEQYKNIIVITAETMNIFEYSAKKNIANFIPEYSVW